MLREVTEARETVFIPSIGARASMLVRKVLPSLAVSAVVLAHGAPGALADIRTDQLPVAGSIRRRFSEPCVLLGTSYASLPAVVYGKRILAHRSFPTVSRKREGARRDEAGAA